MLKNIIRISLIILAVGFITLGIYAFFSSGVGQSLIGGAALGEGGKFAFSESGRMNRPQMGVGGFDGQPAPGMEESTDSGQNGFLGKPGEDFPGGGGRNGIAGGNWFEILKDLGLVGVVTLAVLLIQFVFNKLSQRRVENSAPVGDGQGGLTA